MSPSYGSITLTLFAFATHNIGGHPQTKSDFSSDLSFQPHNYIHEENAPLVNISTDAVGWDRSVGTTSSDDAQILHQLCPKCKNGIKYSDDIYERITEKELRLIRIELIKIQILSKLNLTEAPKVNKKGKHLPSLIQEGRVPGASLDDYLVAPKITPPPSIFVADSRISCPSVIRSPSSCFKFDFSGEVSEVEPKTQDAILWFWKLPDKSDGAPQMITVSQIWLDGMTNRNSDQELLISHLITNITEGWISINISWPSSNMASPSVSPLHIRIACTTCTGMRHRHPVSGANHHRPFIVMQSLSPAPEKVRQKRSTHECNNNNQGCCRSSIYVNFTELGWSDWIYQPKGFTMYYCKGSCRNVSTDSVNSAGHTYTGMLRRLLLDPSIPASLKNDLAPCCSPGHKEPLSLLCRTGRGSNAISVRVLQDMIVQSCSCYD